MFRYELPPLLAITVTLPFAILTNQAKAQSCVEITDPQPLNSNAYDDGANDWRPHFATDGEGTWVAVWYIYNGDGGPNWIDADIVLARSTDGGLTWSAPQYLNTNAPTDSGNDFCPHIASGGMGNWIVAWTSGDDLGGQIGTDGDVLYARSADNGATWTEPRPLNIDAAEDARRDSCPRLANDREGNWIAVWDAYEPSLTRRWGSRVLFHARSADDGATWSAPSRLRSNQPDAGIGDLSPRIAVNGLGQWLTVWSSSDDIDDTIGIDHDILFAMSQDDGTTWSVAQPLNTNAASDNGHDYSAEMASDGNGNWIVVWTSSEDLNGTIGTDLDILFSRSSDGGSSWSEPQPLNSNASSDDPNSPSSNEAFPHIATDGMGNWVAAWNSRDDLGGTAGSDSDILFSHSMDHGANWTPARPIDINAETDDSGDGVPRVATDGSGDWIVAWETWNDLGGTIGNDMDMLFSHLHFVAGDCVCLADLDGDFFIGPYDLGLLLGDWGVCSPNTDCPADLDEDGVVGAEDLELLLQQWGPCPP